VEKETRNRTRGPCIGSCERVSKVPTRAYEDTGVSVEVGEDNRVGMDV